MIQDAVLITNHMYDTVPAGELTQLAGLYQNTPITNLGSNKSTAILTQADKAFLTVMEHELNKTINVAYVERYVDATTLEALQTIEGIEDKDNVLEAVQANLLDGWCMTDVTIVDTPRNIKKVVNTLSTKYTHNKAASNMLQETAQHNIQVFHTNENKILVVTNQTTHKTLRRLLALYPALTKQTTNKEFTIICKLYGSGNDKWQEAVLAYNKERKLHTKILRDKLLSILLKSDQSQITSVTNTVNTLKADYESTEKELRQTLRTLQEKQKLLTSLQLGLADNTEEHREIAEYLLNHKYVHEVKITDEGYVHATIICPITYYEKEALEMYYKRSTTVISRNEYRARFFKEIFLDEKYEFLTQASVTIPLAASTTLTRSRDMVHVQGPYPHPHIMRYNCFGTNATYVRQALETNDSIMAIEQIIASIQNLNFTDTTVITDLANDILDFKENCIRNRETNEMLSPKELYLQYLKENNEEAHDCDDDDDDDDDLDF